MGKLEDKFSCDEVHTIIGPFLINQGTFFAGPFLPWMAPFQHGRHLAIQRLHLFKSISKTLFKIISKTKAVLK